MNDPKLILNQKQKLSTEINDRKPDKDWYYFNNMLIICLIIYFNNY